MRFREEVLAKIFTYITVAVLLGIVAFEAWGLSRERSRRKDAEDNAAVLQEEVENMRDINTTLKKENGELSAFRNKWNVYVSSLTSSEVLELQHDLFMRDRSDSAGGEGRNRGTGSRASCGRNRREKYV